MKKTDGCLSEDSRTMTGEFPEKKEPLLRKVLRTVLKYGMLRPGEKILVAVSGGPDSIALLYVLRALRPVYASSLYVAHLHHGLRGAEADRDAEFVQNTADALGFPCSVERVDVKRYCREKRLSLQEGARQLRYAFFQRQSHSYGCSRIAVGHTADDQAETVLMRLLQGAGLHGMSAIPPMRDAIIRPLIEVGRSEILIYLKAGDISYREDASNLSPAYLRNRIRRELLPILREYNPNIVPRLAKNAGIWREEDRMIDAYIAGLFPDLVCERGEGSLHLNKQGLTALPRPMQRRLIRLALHHLQGEGRRLSSDHVEVVLDLLKRGDTGFGSPTVITLPGEVRVWTDRQKLLFESRPAERVPETPLWRTELRLPGMTEVPEAGLRLETRMMDGPDSQAVVGDPMTRRFDGDRVSFPLEVRNRREGDRFCPSGMGGRHQKLKQFMIDRKIPHRQRDDIPILVSPGGILWIIGWREDERFQVSESSRKVIEVRVTLNRSLQ